MRFSHRFSAERRKGRQTAVFETAVFSCLYPNVFAGVRVFLLLLYIRRVSYETQIDSFVFYFLLPYRRVGLLVTVRRFGFFFVLHIEEGFL